MRVNIYAEEMTDRIEIIGKEIEGHNFTGLRFYLELPATVGGKQYQAPFMHRPGDDDSSAVTFWGKRDLRKLLATAQQRLDQHYEKTPAVQTPVPPALGEFWPGQGGIYVGAMPAREGKPGYHLVIAAPAPGQTSDFKILQASDKTWGPYNHDVWGACDHWDGLANTLAIMEKSGNGVQFPAAQWADALEIHDRSDWYLPAHAELAQMWINVPHLFEASGYYWTSTQYSPGRAWVQDFENGSSGITTKGNEFRAVAVRRLVL